MNPPKDNVKGYMIALKLGIFLKIKHIGVILPFLLDMSPFFSY